MSSRKHKHRGHRNGRRHHRGATAAPAAPAAPQMGVASFFASILQCGALHSPCAEEEDYYSSQDDDSSYEELEERPSRRGRSPRQQRGTNSRKNGADDETADLTAKRGNLTEHTTSRRNRQKTKKNRAKSSQRRSSLYDYSSDEENQDSGSVCSSDDSEIDYAPIVKSGATKSTSQSFSPSSSSDTSFNRGAEFGFETEKNDLNLHPTSGNFPRGGDMGNFHDADSDSDASDMSLNTLLTRQLQLSSQEIAYLRTNPGLDHTRYGLDQHGQYNTYDQHVHPEATTISPRSMKDNFKIYVPPDHLNIVQIEVPPGDIGINLQSTPEGPVVTEVSPYSVASRLCVGDRIIALDGVCVDRCPGRAVMEILQARGRSVRIIKYVPAVPIKSPVINALVSGMTNDNNESAKKKKKKKNKWMNNVIKKRSDALSNEKVSNEQSEKKEEMKRKIKNLQIHTGASQMY